LRVPSGRSKDVKKMKKSGRIRKRDNKKSYTQVLMKEADKLNMDLINTPLFGHF